MNLQQHWWILKQRADKRYGNVVRRIICKDLGPKVPFRYDLYVWFGHLAAVLLDPILYLFGYSCHLHTEAIIRRVLWDKPKKEKE